MARASIHTLLPLDRFFKVAGINPLHANGVFVEDIAPATTCAEPLLQYDWQNADRVGREGIALAIADAEDAFARYSRSKALPTWEVDERVSMRNIGGMYPLGKSVALQTQYAHVISGGKEAKTLISAGAAITYSSKYGGAYKDKAVVTVIVAAGTLPEEIAAYYPDESGATEWEIRPISVTISGTAASITLKREQLVRPELIEEYGVTSGVDGLVDGNFLTTIDVYRHYNDPSQQVQFLWENTPYSCGCSGTSCTTCYLSGQFGCMVVRDNRVGLVAVHPAEWNATDEAFERASLAIARVPERTRLWYRAGYQDYSRSYPTIQMDPTLERAITAYAITLLDRPLCDCNNSAAYSQYWRQDLAKLDSGDSFRISRPALECPLGTTRGALLLWRTIQDKYRVGDAVYG